MVAVGLIVVAVAIAAALLGSRARVARGLLVAGWLTIALLLAVAVALSPGAFELRKFVGLCLMPAGVVWLGLLAFARVLAGSGLRRFAAAALALWVAYTLAGNAWLGGAMAGWLQRGYRSIDPFRQGPFDAVLVLGGGVDVGDQGEPMLTAAGDRVVLAARLFRAGRTKLLVATGPVVALAGGRRASVAAATAAIWAQLGVPAEGIVVLEGPRSTTAEVLALEQAVAQRRWRRVGLLTSAWHLRRAMRLCARDGVEATPLPADFFDPPRPQLRWLVPQQLGFYEVQAVCWEMLGALAGR
jgi:uncharacterized SAM-binding protein YcdF (DUF218 family)